MDSVVQIEGRESVREPAGVREGEVGVEPESEVDAAAQLVEVLVGDAPGAGEGEAAPAAAMDGLAADPRLLPVGVRRPRSLLEKRHDGREQESNSAPLSLSPPRGRGGDGDWLRL